MDASHFMNNTVAFTICANNYLAHAKILAKIFKLHHPNIEFEIALVDERYDTVDYDTLWADRLRWIEHIFPGDLRTLSKKYRIG